MALLSQLFRGDPKLEAAAASDPDHIFQGAKGPHVAKIQQALIQLDGSAIAQDSSYGPGTAAAVRAFKTKRQILNFQGKIDDIVGKKTMAALDAEMAASEGSDDGVPVVSRSPGGTCDEEVSPEAKGGSGTSDLQPADPATIAAIVKLVVKVRLAITAARFQLTLAGPFVKVGEKLTQPTGPFQAPARRSINMLINVFSLDKHKNPRPGFDNISRVFANMDVALNRAFETAPLIASVLFVPNTLKSQEAKAEAYTTAGGAFKSSKIKIKGLGVPADRIYVCNNLMKRSEVVQISTLIHELAHYVSGKPLKISHELGVPKQGEMITNRTALDKITPEAKLRSAEHYSFFALLAGFRRISTDSVSEVLAQLLA